jgi:hypothetical protein
VCRELTKLYEELYRGAVSDALDHFQTPRGEFVLVIEGAPSARPSRHAERPLRHSESRFDRDEESGLGPPARPSTGSGRAASDTLRQQLAALKAQGVTARDAATQLGAPRGVVYKLWRNLD